MTVLVFVWLALLVPGPSAATDITVEGEVVCGDTAHPHLTLSADQCKAGQGRYALKTGSGELYFFIPEDPRAEIFRDPRLWNRTLRITGRLRDESRLEIIALRAVRDGRLYDVYYHCDVCNITTYSDGPCPCCQAPVEYRETPAKD